MYIIEIITPGSCLNYEDDDWCWRVQQQLFWMKGQLFDANTSLNLFIQSQQENIARTVARASSDKAEWDRDYQRRREIERRLEIEKGGRLSFQDREEISFEAETTFKREKWCAGHVPLELLINIPTLHAKSFLYALDGFSKFFKVLTNIDGVPPEVGIIYSRMTATFPDLLNIRNSAHHPEDRARGLNAAMKPMDVKSFDTGEIRSDGGVVMLGGLSGSRFGATKADGHFGEVDISLESLLSLLNIFHALLDAFSWRGPKSHSPSAL